MNGTTNCPTIYVLFSSIAAVYSTSTWAKPIHIQQWRRLKKKFRDKKKMKVLVNKAMKIFIGFMSDCLRQLCKISFVYRWRWLSLRHFDNTLMGNSVKSKLMQRLWIWKWSNANERRKNKDFRSILNTKIIKNPRLWSKQNKNHNRIYIEILIVFVA